MASEGLVIAGRYRLVRLLREGGMGAVWVAHHVTLETECAIKVIRPEVAASEEYLVRFEREARAAARIASANVVKVLDYGSCEIGPYIAMELLEGEDLGQRLARKGRLDPRQTLAILSQVARVLGRARAAGLVHRDLKPENVFLAREDDDIVVKVLDFGVAKVGDADVGSRTRTGVLLGTPAYMSPEQVQGAKSIDHRSDLWSLAVIAFACLTGELPFFGETFGDLLLQIVVTPIPKPSEVWPEAPPGLDAWWARAADRDREGRFQSAQELVRALEEALALPEPTAPPERMPPPSSAPPPLSRAAAERPSPAASILVLPVTRTLDPSLPPPLPRKSLGGLIAVAALAGLIGVAIGLASLGGSPTVDGARVRPLVASGGPTETASVAPAALSAQGPAVEPSVEPAPDEPTATAAPPPANPAKRRPVRPPPAPKKKAYDPGFR